MNEREKIIQLWFEMWLTKQDLGIDNRNNLCGAIRKSPVKSRV